MDDQRTAATPDEDVVELLLHRHGEIRNLFDEVRTTEGDARREAFGRLVRLLAVHETAEEELVHPLARTTVPGGEGVVADRLAEERRAKEALAQLEELGPGEPRFLPLLDTLRRAVLEHARAEERYEFVKLAQETDPATRQSLAAAIRAAETVAPTRPHPGVESASAGSMAAVVDRVRDAVRRASAGSG
ncbi:hemerythrin domain-containing protein [Pseudonocardia bannensis]|uniref:Hemerythrin domain-containing protein n=1 Tax=Pseudonocardia bannensis TaxID=630973 RepID=A0A848DIX6_9PSEU|nr:hemerythrin domain-containing protein [Pseudonocardia bannensis]NMH92404.1 hemerythrin domain-containing protein [Pseudonocardia bannensis]